MKNKLYIRKQASNEVYTVNPRYNDNNVPRDVALKMNLLLSLRKYAYSNTLKMLPPKNENFQIKNSDIFHISAQNIDCGYSLEPPRCSKHRLWDSLEPPQRGGSNEYPQSMF